MASKIAQWRSRRRIRRHV